MNGDLPLPAVLHLSAGGDPEGEKRLFAKVKTRLAKARRVFAVSVAIEVHIRDEGVVFGTVHRELFGAEREECVLHNPFRSSFICRSIS